MAKQSKVISYDGKDYTLATITTKMYRDCGLNADNSTLGDMVVASLKAGGHEDARDLYDALPAFADRIVSQFIEAMREVNGLKLTVNEKGEVVAAPDPAQ